MSKLTSSGQASSVAVCDESSVSFECLTDKEVTVRITFRARLSDLPITSLPDLHDIGKNSLYVPFLVNFCILISYLISNVSFHTDINVFYYSMYFSF